MKILLHDQKTLLMTEVFNSVVFQTEDDEQLAVSMRDDGFEIGLAKKGSKKTRWMAVNSEGVSQTWITEDQPKKV